METDENNMNPVALADDFVRRATAKPRGALEEIAIAQVYATLATAEALKNIAEALRALRPAS